MFRLLKLAAYALLGYALYEFFRGMSDESGWPAAACECNQRKRRRAESAN